MLRTELAIVGEVPGMVGDQKPYRRSEIAVRWLLKAISRFGRAAVDPPLVGIDSGIAGSPT